MKSTMAAALSLVALAGCGSITRGTSEEVAIQVQPADAKVTTDIGLSCVGPCVLDVKRKQSFVVTAEAPGYQTMSVPVATRVSGGGGTAMAGNIIFGGLIGAAVDAGSGAMLDHYPNPVVMQLARLDGTQPPPVLAPPPPTAGPVVASQQAPIVQVRPNPPVVHRPVGAPR